ncbi:MAG TPA: hypothetical protein VFA07_03435 [Chthonomonadaceae bacterium]|nr:hypothetical protein [Chthonomonadaceae bacterium]
MSSIRDSWVSLDTHEFLFALRKEARYPACETLLFDLLSRLQIYMPLQILVELQRNLTANEMRGLLLALNRSKTIQYDYAPVSLDLVIPWERRGAKKGDAVIAAHLESAGVHYFISENRHFLSQLPDLPFIVLTSEEAVQLLKDEDTISS